jgi:hypothetical protein
VLCNWTRKGKIKKRRLFFVAYPKTFCGVKVLSFVEFEKKQRHRCWLNALSLSTLNKIMQAPKAKKIEKSLEIHQHQRQDPYFWMNERENPEVTQYLEQENAYCDFMMKDTEALQEELYEEMKSRYKKTTSLCPISLMPIGILYDTKKEKNTLFLPEKREVWSK